MQFFPIQCKLITKNIFSDEKTANNTDPEVLFAVITRNESAGLNSYAACTVGPSSERFTLQELSLSWNLLYFWSAFDSCGWRRVAVHNSPYAYIYEARPSAPPAFANWMKPEIRFPLTLTFAPIISCALCGRPTYSRTKLRRWQWWMKFICINCIGWKRCIANALQQRVSKVCRWLNSNMMIGNWPLSKVFAKINNRQLCDFGSLRNRSGWMSMLLLFIQLSVMSMLSCWVHMIWNNISTKSNP